MEASIVARVLGIRLLRLEAVVTLAPADVTVPSTSPPDLRVWPQAHGVPLTGSGAPAWRGAGSGLAEAVRSINEGASLLAEVGGRTADVFDRT